MYPAIKFSLLRTVRYTAAADSEYNLSITGRFDLLCEITFPATITVDTFLRVRIRTSNSWLEFVSDSGLHCLLTDIPRFRSHCRYQNISKLEFRKN